MTSAAKSRLTAKQEAFCVYYFALKNGTEAAIRAGYSKAAARFISSALLTKANITDRLAELADRATPDADKLIASVIERKRIYSQIARTPIDDKDITPDHVIRSIAGLNQMERIGQPDTILGGNVTINIQVNYPPGYEALALSPMNSSDSSALGAGGQVIEQFDAPESATDGTDAIGDR